MKVFIFMIVAAIAISGAQADLKSSLLAKAKILVKHSQEAIAHLKKDHLTEETSVLEAQDVLLQKLIKELEAAHEGTDLRQIEQELFFAESVVAAELRFIAEQERHHPHHPVTHGPTTKAPATHAPSTKAPATHAHTTKAPATHAHTTKVPATHAPSTGKF